MKKERIDVLLVEKGFYSSRERAQSALMAGNILVNDKKIDKAGTKVDCDCNIRVIGTSMPYVSRGGLKLAKAIDVFKLDLKDKVAADIGASTGGFTDCMLQNGAKKVYAVDVGYGQLAWSLRSDDRVINLERKNARYLTKEDLPEQIDFMTMDLSFISLDKILPNIKPFLSLNGEIVALVKPQFEAGRENVGKKGVVRDSKVHEFVLHNILQVVQENNYVILGMDFSPIKGPEGNIEYLIYLSNNFENEQKIIFIEDIVQLAHVNAT